MKRRQMGKVKRAEMVNSARKIGRSDAIKKRLVRLKHLPLLPALCRYKRDMIAGSKRRKEKELRAADNKSSAEADDNSDTSDV